MQESPSENASLRTRVSVVLILRDAQMLLAHLPALPLKPEQLKTALIGLGVERFITDRMASRSVNREEPHCGG